MVPWKAFKASACLTVLFVFQRVKERARACSSSRAEIMLNTCWVLNFTCQCYEWPGGCRSLTLVPLLLNWLNWCVLFSVASVASGDSLLKLLCKHRLLICHNDGRVSNRKADSFSLNLQSWVVTHLIGLAEKIPHMYLPAVTTEPLLLLSRRRRRPSFSAGRFHMKTTSTWETTRICAFVGSFTLKQTRRRGCSIDVSDTPSKSFPQLLNVCLICFYATVCARKRDHTQYHSKNNILVSMEVVEFPQKSSDRLFSQLFCWLLCY